MRDILRVPALRMAVSHDLIQITVLEIYLCFSTTNDIQDIALGSAQNVSKVLSIEMY